MNYYDEQEMTGRLFGSGWEVIVKVDRFDDGTMYMSVEMSDESEYFHDNYVTETDSLYDEAVEFCDKHTWDKVDDLDEVNRFLNENMDTDGQMFYEEDW